MKIYPGFANDSTQTHLKSIKIQLSNNIEQVVNGSFVNKSMYSTQFLFQTWFARHPILIMRSINRGKILKIFCSVTVYLFWTVNYPNEAALGENISYVTGSVCFITRMRFSLAPWPGSGLVADQFIWSPSFNDTCLLGLVVRTWFLQNLIPILFAQTNTVALIRIWFLVHITNAFAQIRISRRSNLGTIFHLHYKVTCCAFLAPRMSIHCMSVCPATHFVGDAAPSERTDRDEATASISIMDISGGYVLSRMSQLFLERSVYTQPAPRFTNSVLMQTEKLSCSVLVSEQEFALHSHKKCTTISRPFASTLQFILFPSGPKVHPPSLPTPLATAISSKRLTISWAYIFSSFLVMKFMQNGFVEPKFTTFIFLRMTNISERTNFWRNQLLSHAVDVGGTNRQSFYIYIYM